MSHDLQESRYERVNGDEEMDTGDDNPFRDDRDVPGENDMARALSNFESIHIQAHPCATACEKRQQQWVNRCSRHSELMKNWHANKISMETLGSFRPRCFYIDTKLYAVVVRKEIKAMGANLMKCSKDDYIKFMKFLLLAEEAYQAIEMRKLDTANKRLKVEYDLNNDVTFFGFNERNLSHRSPAIMATDFVILEDESKSFAKAFRIDSIKGDNVGFRRQFFRQTRHALRTDLNISYISAGTPFRYCHAAITRLEEDLLLKDIVFEDVGQPEGNIKINVAETNTDELRKRLECLNPSQRKALIGILEAKCRPKPYILFGPPGTGKTHTLIEAIVQVFERTKSATECQSTYFKKILVSVNSNTCADDLTKKLKKAMPSVKVQRIFAGEAINKTGDIVVTTNIKSGCLASQFKFEYVFLDEAGHANAPESLIPISTLAMDGCLVLAGDPKQLGPVVMCKDAGEEGLNQTLLERLFEYKIYQLDPITNEYNSDYITMLQDCYRCDERILAPCNKLFYHNQLECINETPWGLLALLQLSWPVQLKHTAGEEAQHKGSTSWYNQYEADVCCDLYLRLLKMGFNRRSIGITSPYKDQVKLITADLKRGQIMFGSHLHVRFNEFEYVKLKVTNEVESLLKQPMLRALNPSEKLPAVLYEKVDDQYVEYDLDAYPNRPVTLYEKKAASHWLPKVDSIDAFQGNEKEVMIISTVRTDRDVGRLEFLNDARRFNVAVSRAKWLLIIIGDQNVLELGDYWPELMRAAKTEITKWPVPTGDLNPYAQTPLFRSR